MALENRLPQKRGRPTKGDSLQLRTEIFKMLLAKCEESPEKSLLEYRAVEEALRINGKTVRAIFSEIANISADIALCPEGICVGYQTYYHSNVRRELGFKNAIAKEFVQLIPSNVTLACSAGTTVTYCVKHLVETRHYHVIVTNNMGIVDQLKGSDIANLVLSGGEYKPGIHGCVGNKAVEAFKDARCEAALIGISGINDEGELFLRHCEEIAVLDRIVRTVTHFIFIVADIYKLTQVDTWRFAKISQLLDDKQRPDLRIYLITNSHDSLSQDKYLRDRAKKVCNVLQNMDPRLEVVLAK